MAILEKTEMLTNAAGRIVPELANGRKALLRNRRFRLDGNGLSRRVRHRQRAIELAEPLSSGGGFGGTARRTWRHSDL